MRGRRGKGGGGERERGIVGGKRKRGIVGEEREMGGGGEREGV